MRRPDRVSGFCLLVALLTVACGQPVPTVTAIDLLKRSTTAERRPASGEFPIVEHSCADERMASQVVPVPSRLTYTMNFPARARFLAAVAVTGSADARAEFRIGISDRRLYETLHVQSVAASSCGSTWQQVAIDLARYGGRQWSVFYRPDQRRWELILGVTRQQGDVGTAVWGAPRIETDGRAARAFLAARRD